MAIFDDILGSVTRTPVGRNRRISSNEQPNWSDGNFDMTPLVPGQVFELGTLQGPGVITHIWFTSHAGGVGELDSLTLRIYWDGRDEPGVEVPVGDFFAVGHGKPAVVESVPVQVSPSGSLSCYWRMPFRSSARIVVSNDNPDRMAGLYWQVDWTEMPDLPEDTLYFHAKYRQEYPAVMGRDYLVADLEGAGNYVGTVLSVTLAQDGWFGEGDDFFFIDGEDVPSLQGTGTEDYFNDAWGFRERTSAWFGQPRWQGYSAGDSGVCYRWHLPDPVHFSSSLRFTIEHKGNMAESEDGWFIERPDFLRSVAFWYQSGLPKPWPALPPYPERCVPWIREHFVRAFQAARAIGGAAPSISTTGMFGGRPVLVWPNRAMDGRLTIPFHCPARGRFAVRLIAGTAPGRGEYLVEIDGRECGTTGQGENEDDVLLGVHELDADMHAVSFRPSDPRTGPLIIEELRLLALPSPAYRDIKGDNEAHFVRLGIGRAVFAFRLAFDRLPSSLEELVNGNLMDARYLSDENNVALTSRLDGDRFTVTSHGPGAWTWSWKGLDARR